MGLVPWAPFEGTLEATTGEHGDFGPRGAARCAVWSKLMWGREHERPPRETEEGTRNPGGGSWGPAVLHTLVVENVTRQGTWPRAGLRRVACSMWLIDFVQERFHNVSPDDLFYFILFILFFKRLHLFLERREGREKDRERETSM